MHWRSLTEIGLSERQNIHVKISRPLSRFLSYFYDKTNRYCLKDKNDWSLLVWSIFFTRASLVNATRKPSYSYARQVESKRARGLSRRLETFLGRATGGGLQRTDLTGRIHEDRGAHSIPTFSTTYLRAGYHALQETPRILPFHGLQDVPITFVRRYLRISQ